MRKYVYDVYVISVPGDAADNLEALANLAIAEARERARLYCMPALWTAARLSGNLDSFEVVFRVTRKRNNPKRNIAS